MLNKCMGLYGKFDSETFGLYTLDRHCVTLREIALGIATTYDHFVSFCTVLEAMLKHMSPGSFKIKSAVH